ncbi:hypothetical protein SAMN06313540_10510 [Epsilonproteobacteria bacterium SCGC AD-308-E02]|jgi:hypothetical protein|nr:hypothetical protein SAMN06313540_10510 [Epsilonproteobacteria bacterium SCGC AD-308-E02]
MIKKIIYLLLVLSVPLFANQYDSTIVDIEAKLFPKMALMEEHVANNNSAFLNIIILTKEIDLKIANSFKSTIESLYPDIVLNKRIIVKVTQLGNPIQNEADAVIVLHHSAQELQTIALWANQNKILSFAYEPSYLEYGLLSSIYIGRTIKPYLNINTIKKYGFGFNSYLMQLSKFKK